jgi:hypothetical protein
MEGEAVWRWHGSSDTAAEAVMAIYAVMGAS